MICWRREFEGNPLIEWMDLMQYGFWGEGHTSDYPSPFPDYLTAERTLFRMTERQLETWKRTPLAVNTQPDISNVGNRTVIDMAVRAGAWLRSDSIIVEEPIQIEELQTVHHGSLPYWKTVTVAIRADEIETRCGGYQRLENYMLHVLDVRANYWCLWTEADNLARYNEKYPRGFDRLRTSLGYRLRPAWVWQRKRYGTSELIVCVSNRGVAGVPACYGCKSKARTRKFRLQGALDAGHPHGGGLRQASFLLPQGYVGKIQLSAQLEIRPRREEAGSLGMRAARQCGWLHHRGAESCRSDPGWRKGV